MTIYNINKKECCGCALCSIICVKHCIKMQSDAEGFLTPIIDDEQCINCGLCYKKCPVSKAIETYESPRYYAAAISNKEELLYSSSGGLFVSLAKHILSIGGYVCGCVWDEHMRAIHICSNKIEDIYRMMGSKYVQSTIEKVLPEIIHYVNDGHKVLFTGTACQIAAVKSLNPSSDNLYFVDILCHGVPSPLFFRKYVGYLEKKHSGRLTNLEFRDKKKLGWGSEHRTYYEIERNGKVKGYRPILPAYFCAFFYGTNLRESCYNCKYAGEQRISDITIGDFWGYMAYYRRRFLEGLSIASVNTKKGLSLFNSIKGDLSFCDEIPKDKAKGTNTNFYHPTHRYSSRDTFYSDIYNSEYKDYIWKIYLDKCTRKQFLTSLYGRFMPECIKKLRHALK